MSPKLHTENLFNSSGCLTLSALERYRDKQLGVKEQERVKSHLSGCEMCSDALEGLIMLPAGSSARPDIREVNARLRKRYHYTPAGARDEKKDPRLSQFLIPAAASIILLAGIIGYFNYFLPKTQELAIARTEEVVETTREEKELAPEQQPTTQQAPKEDIEEEKNIVVENDDEGHIEETITIPPPVVGGVAEEDNKQTGAKTIADQDVVIITETVNETKEEITFDKVDDEDVSMAEEELSIEAPSPSMAKMEDEKVYIMEDVGVVTENNQKSGKSEIRAKRMAKEEVLDDEVLFTIVEKMPEFPGGEDSLFRFIQTNFKLPIDSSGQFEGKAYVSFIVGMDGRVSDVKILRGIWSAFNKEAIRVIEMMPAWIPGEQRGKPVTVQMTLPITYTKQ